MPVKSTFVTGDGEKFSDMENLLRTLLQKELIDKPPHFSVGENIILHIEHMEEFFTAINVTDEDTKLAMLSRSLSDRALKELKCLPDYNTERDYDWVTSALTKLFKTKESDLSPVLKLLETKQNNGQSIRDFISELRVEGYSLLEGYSAEDRESMLVNAFINGLINQNLAVALRARSPKTLDEAFKLIKQDESNFNQNNDSNLRLVKHSNLSNTIDNKDNKCLIEILSLKNEVSSLKHIVTNLVSLLSRQNSLSKTHSFNTATNMRYKNNDGIEHYNNFPNKFTSTVNRTFNTPNKNFNSANKTFNTPNRRFMGNCFNCGKPGHLARFCNKIKSASYRQIFHSACSSKSSTTSDIDDNHDTNLPASNYQLDNSDAKPSDQDCFVMSLQKNLGFTYVNFKNRNNKYISKDNNHSVKSKNNKTRKNLGHNQTRSKRFIPPYSNVNSKRFQENETYDTWLNSITKTVISKAYSEKAANKPIIKGKLENKTGKIFCDSGAEINFIATETAELMKRENNKCLIFSNKYNIKCANGSHMKNNGVIELELEIAGKRSKQRFAIVDNLFPRVIIGMKTMKDIGLKINPKNSGVEINGNFVPFLSKVESIDESKSVNFIQSSLSTGV